MTLGQQSDVTCEVRGFFYTAVVFVKKLKTSAVSTTD